MIDSRLLVRDADLLTCRLSWHLEGHEVAHDFHKLQLRLLARPGLRAVGWPQLQVDASANTEGRI